MVAHFQHPPDIHIHTHANSCILFAYNRSGKHTRKALVPVARHDMYGRAATVVGREKEGGQKEGHIGC